MHQAAGKPEAVPIASIQRAVRVVIPDIGPLISLALGDVLGLPLLIREGVRFSLTDVVKYEATHRSDDLPGAEPIKNFIRDNRDRIDVIPTTVGSLALDDIKRKREAGLPASLPKDIGELAITSFVISLRTANPGDPTLVIVDDDWFESNAYALPGNLHLLSTSAWLDGLEQMKGIESAAEIRARIQKASS